MNPYVQLLYEHLAQNGFEKVDGGTLRLGWLWANRRGVDALHFHWPYGQFRYRRPPRRLQRVLSWIKLFVFGLRLGAARALGYRLAWTIHQVYPHETMSRTLERAGARLLARACHLLLAHDVWTAETARRELGKAAAGVKIVPHGSYVGVYPRHRSRSAVRTDLAIPSGAFVFLCFGEVRAYKDVDLLLSAFDTARLREAVLIVAGHTRDAAAGDRIAAAARADPRIKPLLTYVPDDGVGDLFGAADAAVLPRGDGATSGSLVLALSMGLPVVVADRPTYRELVQDGRAGWLFEVGSADSLRSAMERAAANVDEARRRGRAARAAAATLRWSEVAARTARLLELAGR